MPDTGFGAEDTKLERHHPQPHGVLTLEAREPGALTVAIS